MTTNLTKDDFTILDDKHKKEIYSFDGPNGAPGLAALPTSNIIVVDHVNTQFEDESWQIQQLQIYFKNQGDLLNQQTELLVFTDNGLQVVQGFTRDRADMLEAVKSIHSIVPYRITANWDAQNLSLAMAALEEVGLQMKTTPGRKNILWIGSGGVGLQTHGLFGEGRLKAYVRRTANLLVESRVTLFVILPSLRVSGSIQPRGEVNPLTTSVDPINGSSTATVAPTATDPFIAGVNMRTFAATTGGKVFLNSNAIATEVEDSVTLGTRYYTLSYKPDDSGTDGAYKRIAVRMKDSKLQALTKGGYYTASKDDDSLAGDHEVRFELRKAAVSSVTFPDIKVKVKGVTYYKPEQTSLFEVDLSPDDLRFDTGPDGKLKCSLAVVAVSENGTHDILASSTMSIALTASTPEVAHTKTPVLKASLYLRVPCRTSTLRFVVRDMLSGKMGTAELPRTVADATPLATSPMPEAKPRLGSSDAPAAAKPNPGN